jgi:hypothetical protein
LAKTSGNVSVNLNAIVADIDVAKKNQAKVTERVSLSIARFKSNDFDSGWKVVGFGPLKR